MSQQQRSASGFEPEEYDEAPPEKPATKAAAAPPVVKPVDEQALVARAAAAARKEVQQHNQAEAIRRAVEEAAAASDPEFAKRPAWMRDGVTGEVMERLRKDPKIAGLDETAFRAEVKRVAAEVAKEVPRGGAARTDEAALDDRLETARAHGAAGPVKAAAKVQEPEDEGPDWGLSTKRVMPSEQEIERDAEKAARDFWKKEAAGVG